MEVREKLSVLLIDSGGRGHALAWKLRQSPRLDHLWIAPGNAGTSQIADNVPIKATDINELLEFALIKRPDITIVSQDDPLALGIVDLFQANSLKIFGPSQAAAQIESSKSIAKGLMRRCNVETADYKLFAKYNLALEHVYLHFATTEDPIVIKVDGPALGKGVYVCKTFLEAEGSLREIMLHHVHGDAGNIVVIEEFVDGYEASMHAFSDGNTFHLFPAAQDHKRAFDGDKGPNTGGMGSITPIPGFKSYTAVGNGIVGPILRGLKDIGSPFVGVLFPGLMMSKNGPKVLEFNARPGDPETQVYMRLLETDLLDIIEACIEGRIHEVEITWRPVFAACVVMASAGYPSPDYVRGVPITGIEAAEQIPGVVVFHAGTKEIDGELVTSGGRVLGVTAIGDTLQEAIDAAYRGVKLIHFEGAHYRTDIGTKALALEAQTAKAP